MKRKEVSKQLENAVIDFIIEFDVFFRQGTIRNHWFYTSLFKLYARKSFHVVDGKAYQFIDIASIAVEPEYQNTGIFTTLLKTLLNRYPNENFFIESVVNPVVTHVAQKFGFIIQLVNGDASNGYNLHRIVTPLASN